MSSKYTTLYVPPDVRWSIQELQKAAFQRWPTKKIPAMSHIAAAIVAYGTANRARFEVLPALLPPGFPRVPLGVRVADVAVLGQWMVAAQATEADCFSAATALVCSEKHLFLSWVGVHGYGPPRPEFCEAKAVAV